MVAVLPVYKAYINEEENNKKPMTGKCSLFFYSLYTDKMADRPQFFCVTTALQFMRLI
jgi:hypothetical protein